MREEVLLKVSFMVKQNLLSIRGGKWLLVGVRKKEKRGELSC